MAERRRQIGALLAAGLVSQTGDWLLKAALVFEAYRLTGSTTVTGLTALATLTPQACLGRLGGLLVDRWNPRRTMVVVNVLAALALLPLLAVRDARMVWLIYPTAAVEAVLALLFVPAEAAVTPTLADSVELVRLNGWNGLTRNASRLVGSAAGGLLVSAAGLKGVTLVDSASYVAAAALLTPLALDRSAALPAVTRCNPSRMLRTTARAMQHRLRRAPRACRAAGAVRLLLAFTLIAYVGQGVMSTLFAPFVSTTLHAGAGTYGLILAAQAVGGILGGALARRVSHRLGLWRAFAIGAALFGAGDLALFLYPLAYPHPAPALALMLVVGIPGAISVAAYTTLLQRSSAPGGVGRTFGAVATMQGMGELVGIGLATALAPRIGIIAVISVQGIGYLAGGLAVLLVVRHLRPRHTAARGPRRSRPRLLVTARFWSPAHHLLGICASTPAPRLRHIATSPTAQAAARRTDRGHRSAVVGAGSAGSGAARKITSDYRQYR